MICYGSTNELPLASLCGKVCRQLGPISRPLASILSNQIRNSLHKGNDESVDTGFASIPNTFPRASGSSIRVALS
jgi:hypothetical protein